MNCKFVVYNVPWEKRKELLQHECVGLQERVLSCERSQPVKAAEPMQNDIKEMFDKVHGKFERCLSVSEGLNYKTSTVYIILTKGS